ncbi:HAMP domain-containing protein [uncultured Methanospirillum sp.]|uniref:PDC sensor domain-containing protein n=1 Tax=uncultured Methanospirillum sp. TaxID=262503 RepID=UPI0029C7AC90|nr:HAMP domain-containing protein [uncultured Methanospirillum sp.]
MLKSVFQANPHFIQIYSTWEPNAFDGKDREFEGIAPYDSNGRYETDWFRDDTGTITEYEYKEDESVDYSADWYLSAKDAGSAVLLEPYLDEIEGEQVLMTSVIAPVNVGEEFLGVVGADIAMDFLQAKVDALPESSESMMVMVTPEGEIAAATRRPDLVGTHFTGLIPDETISQAIEQSGGARVYKTSQGGTSITQVPVRIGSGEKPWTIAVLTPEEEITRDANALILQLIAVASLMIAVGLILLFTASRRITAPLKYLITGMKRLADGDKSVQIPVISQDEIGKVNTEFNSLIRILVNREQKLAEHAQAQQDLNEAIIMTAESVKMGNLESALDEERFDEEFKKLAAGINELIAWIRTPI